MINLQHRYFMNPGLLSLSLSGYGGGEAPVWSTHCCRARMGGWIFSPDPTPPHSCYVSGLVFLWCELSCNLSNKQQLCHKWREHHCKTFLTVCSFRSSWSRDERSDLLWSVIACLPPQDEILMLAFQECKKVLMQCNNQPFHRKATDYYMCKHILHVQPYKVSQQPVSIHLPISRLLAGRRPNIWDSLWFIGMLCQLWTYDSVHCDPQACMYSSAEREHAWMIL